MDRLHSKTRLDNPDVGVRERRHKPLTSRPGVKFQAIGTVERNLAVAVHGAIIVFHNIPPISGAIMAA